MKIPHSTRFHDWLPLCGEVQEVPVWGARAHQSSRRAWRTAFGLVLIVSLVTLSYPVVAAENAAGDPTFNEDIAVILYDNCASCHRAGQMAPMALTSYRDARPWARAIKGKVLAREMPPWYADPRYGSFRNEMTLTQDEIDTLVAWADAGAPEGTGEAPQLPTFSDGWMHPSGQDPDIVIQMPIEYEIPAEGQSENFSIYQESPFDEVVDLQAIQLLPGNLRATHHSSLGANRLPEGTRLGRGPAYPGGPIIDNVPVSIDVGATFDNSGDRNEDETSETDDARRTRLEREAFAVQGTSLFVFYVPAAGFKQWPAGIGKRIEPDDYLNWGVHYNSIGVPETDRHSAGLWLQKGEMTHEVLSRRVGQTHIAERRELVAPHVEDGRAGPARIPVIPPGEADWAITGITTFQDDVTLYIVWPHMHVRGKDMTFVVTYPDGREEILLHVPRYEFNWQLHYEFEEPVKLPAGTTIKTIGHFDNSVRNRYNPAPDKEVYWADQSWDEMFNGRIDYSVDKLDLRLATSGIN